MNFLQAYEMKLEQRPDGGTTAVFRYKQEDRLAQPDYGERGIRTIKRFYRQVSGEVSRVNKMLARAHSRRTKMSNLSPTYASINFPAGIPDRFVVEAPSEQAARVLEEARTSIATNSRDNARITMGTPVRMLIAAAASEVASINIQEAYGVRNGYLFLGVLFAAPIAQAFGEAYLAHRAKTVDENLRKLKFRTAGGKVVNSQTQTYDEEAEEVSPSGTPASA